MATPESWYCDPDRKMHGPFTLEELQALANRGLITGKCKIRTTAEGPWLKPIDAGVFVLAPTKDANERWNSPPDVEDARFFARLLYAVAAVLLFAVTAYLMVNGGFRPYHGDRFPGDNAIGATANAAEDIEDAVEHLAKRSSSSPALWFIAALLCLVGRHLLKLHDLGEQLLGKRSDQPQDSNEPPAVP